MATSLRPRLVLLLFLTILLVLHISNVHGAEEKKRRRLKDVHITVLKEGEDCSTRAAKGDVVVVDYTGKLEDGQVFDSSHGEGREPIAFKLGAMKVIPGWEKGVLDTCVGEERRLLIPPHLAYGDQGVPPHIPEKATLEFEVKVVDIQKPSSLKSILSFLKFAALPVALGIAILFAFQKWRSREVPTTPSKKKLKEERRTMLRNKRK